MLQFFQKKNFEHCTDEQLLQAIVRGQEAAFNQLYQRYADKMFRYFYRLLDGDKSKSEDFLQELFLKIFAYAVNFSTAQKASTWIYTLATNMCKNEWRNNENRSKKITHFDGWEQPPPSVVDNLQNKQHAILINDLLHQLEEQERFIIQLRFQQELSVPEIAQILNIPEGTVKSRIFYLLRKLGKQITIKSIN